MLSTTNKQQLQQNSPPSPAPLTISTALQQQQQNSSSNTLTSSTAYTLLNAIIKILSNSEKISRKQQQQVDLLINFWKNFDVKSIQVNTEAQICVFF